jgi:murein DD-endopeptidase MepM/ murein hydrolase activator NlpD
MATKIDYLNPITKSSDLTQLKTSNFGPRSVKVGSTYHLGTDYSAARNTPIYSAADGVVIKVGSNIAGYGNVVVVKHNNGEATIYAHLTSAQIAVGAKVTAGQQIALSGNTGVGTGPHFHFGVIKPEYVNVVENTKVVNKLGISYEEQYYTNPIKADISDGKSQPTFTTNLSPEIDAIMNGSYPSDGDPIMPATELTTSSASTKEQFSAQLQTPEAKQATTFFKIAA